MEYHHSPSSDTIIALASPAGIGALSIIRISGQETFQVFSKFFRKKGFNIQEVKSHTLHFGNLVDEDEKLVDEILASVFRGPNSFTGEDTIEITTHGSVYIQQKVLDIFLKAGVRIAKPGEFSMRAFFNGKLDLSQAEAIADVISSTSAAAHQVALNQLKGGVSKEIKHLREQLIDFASLIELELDFSEEDVEFADRTQLWELLNTTESTVDALISSFKTGNAIKNGIPVAIAGEPNVGKSTLLNALLNEEKAIVSDIPGTTRDAIEDVVTIEGIEFRFIDTAGIRETSDKVENIGIGRSFEKMKSASIIMVLFDVATTSIDQLQAFINEISLKADSKKLLLIGNKLDQLTDDKTLNEFEKLGQTVFISARDNRNIDKLRLHLLEMANAKNLTSNETIITNARHHEALMNTKRSIEDIKNGMSLGLSQDLVAIDIRKALHHLGEITGAITTDDLLGNIFGKFCIGK